MGKELKIKFASWPGWQWELSATSQRSLPEQLWIKTKSPIWSLKLQKSEGKDSFSVSKPFWQEVRPLRLSVSNSFLECQGPHKPAWPAPAWSSLWEPNSKAESHHVHSGSSQALKAKPLLCHTSANILQTCPPKGETFQKKKIFETAAFWTVAWRCAPAPSWMTAADLRMVCCCKTAQMALGS